MRIIQETIKVPPLSVNKAWQGRRFKTQEYKKWEENALLTMPHYPKIKGQVLVELHFYMRYPKKGDIDNPIKPALDLLTKKKWIEDDRLIYSLIVQKEQSKEERIEVEIIKL